ncbi:MAG: response regulator transcription factor [Chitinophagaceae bacterium]|nr:MAG: response regulator transcription factor [Chitinophagaceae bacterium]
MITVLIIDDHPLVANGIATMIRDVDHLQVIGSCKTAAAALELLATQTPSVILLDISLPDIDGLELCSRIRKTNKESRIVGLTSTNEAGIISQLLTRGGNGYLLKNMEREELLQAIDTVMDDKIFLSRAANEKLLEQYRSASEAMTSSPVLTRREKEILQLLHEGLNGPQIAAKLFISHYTVETHRKNLMQKLNASTTQALLKTAKENRFI